MMNTAMAVDGFLQAIEAAGLTPPSEIIEDGQLHRFSSNGDLDDDAGWYCLFLDTVPAGAFGCWRRGIKETWCAKSERSLTKDDRAKYRDRIATAQRQRDEEERRRHEEAAARAKEILEPAKSAPSTHQYLKRKNIKAHGVRITINGELIISVMIDGQLSSLQFINADGGKRFLSGGTVAGGSHTLGDVTNPKVILISEGFATAAALHEATGLPVVMAFSAGNLLPVAQAIRERHSTANIIICGDHDRSEVGQKAATEAAKAVGGCYAIPPSAGDDWNDVFVRQGSEAVRSAIDLASDNYDRISVEDLAGSYRVTFLSHDLALNFQRMSENARGVSAELTVIVGQRELLGDTDIGLKSDTSRDKLARSLSQTSNHIPWKRLLERACSEVLKRHRRGEPIVLLEPADSVHISFVVNPLVYYGHQTLLFAPGGSYKSYLVLYFALLSSAGLRQNGIGAIRTNVLYLDWELDKKTVGARLKALHTGHPELAPYRPHYRRCTQPLHLEVPYIAAEVVQLNIGLVIIDSAALACGGDLHSPESAIKLQQALRRIGCASIVLAHVSKSTADGQDKSAYGTVFFRELARNVWELSRPEGSDRVVLSQTGASCKNSFGRKQDPLGFEFSFEPDRVRITAFNPSEEEESGFEEKLPARQRIIRLLSDLLHRDPQGIADALHLPLSTVKSELSRGKRDGTFDRFGPYQGGKWGLKKSLQPIVAAKIDAPSLQSLQRASESSELIEVPNKRIVAPIDDGRCTKSLLHQGGYYIPPSATITDSTINNSQPEEVIDL